MLLLVIPIMNCVRIINFLISNFKCSVKFNSLCSILIEQLLSASNYYRNSYLTINEKIVPLSENLRV